MKFVLEISESTCAWTRLRIPMLVSISCCNLSTEETYFVSATKINASRPELLWTCSYLRVTDKQNRMYSNFLSSSYRQSTDWCPGTLVAREFAWAQAENFVGQFENLMVSY